MNRSIGFLLAGIGAAILAANAHATMINGNVTGGSSGGTFVKLGIPFTNSHPGNTVGRNNFQSDDLFGFDEEQNITITSEISVDILASTAAAGLIAAGTVVASHYVFFDPARIKTLEAIVDFDAEILAVIHSTNNLLDSDILINTGVTYLNPRLRGLESGYDRITISNPNQIQLSWSAGNPGDYVRILTKASPRAAIANIPEPGILSFLGLVLFGLWLKSERHTSPQGQLCRPEANHLS